MQRSPSKHNGVEKKQDPLADTQTKNVVDDAAGPTPDVAVPASVPVDDFAADL